MKNIKATKTLSAKDIKQRGLEKISRQQKQKNTIKNIVSILKKHQKNKFKNDFERKEKAKQLIQDFKKKKIVATVRNVIKSRKVTKKRKKIEKLRLPQSMQGRQAYFRLCDLPNEIKRGLSNKIQIHSRVSPRALPYLNSENVDVKQDKTYYLYFQAFVNHCNNLSAFRAREGSETDESGEFFFIITEPNKKGLSVLFPCDVFGNEVDYHFDREQNVVMNDNGELVVVRKQKKYKRGEREAEQKEFAKINDLVDKNKTKERGLAKREISALKKENKALERIKTKDVAKLQNKTDSEIRLAEIRLQEQVNKRLEKQADSDLLSKKLDFAKTIDSLMKQGWSKAEIKKQLGRDDW